MMAKYRQPNLTHPRVHDLASIVDQLNVWAMAPSDASRVAGLKKALNTYCKAVKTKRYLPTTRNFVMRTGYCNEPPPAAPDSFEAFFGAPEPAPDAPPWEA